MVDVLQIAKQIVIERDRRLPLAGRVLVAVGDTVRPGDVVAEALLPAGVVTLDIGRGLGVSAREAEAHALRKPGEMVKAGDLLAQREGRLPRAVRAPADGLLMDFSKGKMLLATTEVQVAVTAGMPGVVTEVYPEFGVKLRVEGGLVQGEWGSGGSCEGSLHAVEALSEETDDADLAAGEILALPSVANAEVFDLVTSKELAGLVTFWLAPDLLRRAEALGVPVVVISGFGAGPVDDVAWELLAGHAGKLSCLNAAGDGGAGRPELILPGEGESPVRALGLQAALAVGQRVRILTGAAAGLAGRVEKLEAPLLFESGFSFPTATIDLADGNQVQVPQQNLVILGE